MMRSTIAALYGAVLLSAAPLAAQMPAASSTKGFFIGAHLTGSSVTVEADGEDEEQSGGGAGLQLGYGFTPRLALFIDGTGTVLEDDVGFGHVDFGVRYSFTSPTRRWVPSIEVALTGRALTQEDADFGGGTGDVTLSGGGVTFGVGLQYYTAPKWAIGAALKVTGGDFDNYTVDNVTISGLDIDATSTRFNIGVTWYPMAGR